MTSAQVIECRKLYREGHSFKQIGAFYGRSAQIVHDAITGRTWKELPNPVKPNEIRSTGKSGTFNNMARLDEDEVIEIKKLLLGGSTLGSIARTFGVSRNSISKIAHKKRYSNIGPELLDKNYKTNMSNRRGIAPASAKIDALTASYIKWHLHIGVAICLLAKYFKVAPSTIRAIAKGIFWKNVKPKKSYHRILASGRELPIRLCGERLTAKIKEVKDERRASQA